MADALTGRRGDGRDVHDRAFLLGRSRRKAHLSPPARAGGRAEPEIVRPPFTRRELGLFAEQSTEALRFPPAPPGGPSSNGVASTSGHPSLRGGRSVEDDHHPPVSASRRDAC